MLAQVRTCYNSAELRKTPRSHDTHPQIMKSRCSHMRMNTLDYHWKNLPDGDDKLMYLLNCIKDIIEWEGFPGNRYFPTTLTNHFHSHVIRSIRIYPCSLLRWT